MAQRLFDLVVATAALVILSPLLLVLAVAVRIASPGPAFYRGPRIGRDGRPFAIYKFRSMVLGGHTQGAGITTRDDPRVTPLGRLLRSSKLDELPQLLNIVIGDMSIVGPRPEDPRYVAFYTAEQREVLRVRPGMTSPASVAYRHEESQLTGEDWEQHYIHVVMPAKLAIERRYLATRTLVADLGVIWQTIRAVITRAA